MDFSWLEVLPLPKSRPGWVVVILLSLLGSVFFLLIQPKLLETALNEVDTKASISGNGVNGVSQIIFPKTIMRNDIIPITIKVISYDDTILQIQSVKVTWHCYFDRGTFIDNRGVVDSEILPIASDQASLAFQTPSCIDENTTNIGGAFSITLVKPNENFNTWNDVYIDINGWKASRNSILSFLGTMKYGLAIIVLLALISAGVAESKQHQDVILDSKEGGNTTRQIFLRASLIFLIILAVMTALLAPDNYVRGLIVCILLLILLAGWLVWPKVQAYWNTIQNQPRVNKHTKPKNKDVKTVIEGSSQAEPIKTKSSIKSLRIKTTEKKSQKTPHKRSRPNKQ